MLTSAEDDACKLRGNILTKAEGKYPLHVAPIQETSLSAHQKTHYRPFQRKMMIRARGQIDFHLSIWFGRRLRNLPAANELPK